MVRRVASWSEHGGGFLLFLARDKQALRATMRDLGLPEVPMGIDYRGTTVSED